MNYGYALADNDTHELSAGERKPSKYFTYYIVSRYN